jgi:SPP1 family predicted phage head-tail adaptor
LFDKRDWIHRVTIQRTSYVTDDGGGNIVATLTLYRKVPCFIKFGPANESKSNDRQQAEATHSITFKSDPSVRNGDRVIFGDRLFIVTGTVNEFELSIVYTVTCTEILR